jgi:hypothetical protein
MPFLCWPAPVRTVPPGEEGAVTMPERDWSSRNQREPLICRCHCLVSDGLSTPAARATSR